MPDTAILLRVARAATGRTQSEVAQSAGVLRVRLSDWERGRRRPRPEAVRRIIEVLAMPLDEEPGESETAAGIVQAITDWLHRDSPAAADDERRETSATQT